MNATVLKVLQEITARYGEAVLGEAARLKALLNDLAKDEPRPLHIAFGRCIEGGAYTALKTAADAAERASRKGSIAQRVRDKHGIDPAFSAEALDLLEAALFGTAGATPRPQSPPRSPAPPTPPAPQRAAEQAPDRLGYEENGCGMTITKYISRAGVSTVVIPDRIKGKPVTAIGNEAFAECGSLRSVTIPNGVTSIGDGAFAECGGLRSVTIPGSVTSIGNGAFAECRGLRSVTIPGSVTAIGNSAFSGCGGLASVTIPNSVTAIGNYAFRGCGGLTSVTLSRRTRVGKNAFPDGARLIYRD